MSNRQWIYSACVLGGLAAIGTWFAAAVYPRWDDAWLDMLPGERGAQLISESLQDRPVLGEVFEWMFLRPESFYLKAVAVHWFVGVATGLCTLFFANQLFPQRAVLSLATACLAATTFLCRAQIVLVTPVVVPGMSALLPFFATILLAGAAREGVPIGNTAVRWAGAIVCLVSAGLLSEYFVASTLAGSVWLLLWGWSRGPNAWPRAYRSAGILVVLMVAIYLIYHQTASAAARTEVRPESFLQNGIAWRLKVTLPVWMTSSYAACMGAMLERIGSLRIQNNPDVLSMAVGLVLAALISVPLMRRGGTPPDSMSPTLNVFVLVACVAAVAAGLLPTVVMGRRPDTDTLSGRYLMTVSPYAICASVGLLDLLLKQRWTAWLLAPLCAIVAGFAQVSDGMAERREFERVASWGPELRSRLADDGITVAILDNGWLPGGELVPNDYEVVARVTRDWPVEERRRFWLFPNLSTAIDEDRSVGIGLHFNTRGISFDRTLTSPSIHRSARNLDRVGPIRRVLWVYVTPTNELKINEEDFDDGAAPR